VLVALVLLSVFSLAAYQGLNTVLAAERQALGEMARWRVLALAFTRIDNDLRASLPGSLGALFDHLSLAEAYALAAKRDHAWFRNSGDLRNAVAEGVEIDDARFAYTSRFFLVSAQARHGRIAIAEQALLDRQGKAMPVLLWRVGI